MNGCRPCDPWQFLPFRASVPIERVLPRRASVPSSNRACGFPAHGSPTAFTGRHSVVGLGRTVELALQYADPVPDATRFGSVRRRGTSRFPWGGIHAIPPASQAWTEVPALRSRRVVLSRRSKRYYGRVRLPGRASAAHFGSMPYSASYRPPGPRPRAGRAGVSPVPGQVLTACRSLLRRWVRGGNPVGVTGPDTRLPRSFDESSPTAPDSASYARRGIAHGACSRFAHATACGFASALGLATTGPSAGLLGPLSPRLRPRIAPTPWGQASPPNGKCTEGCQFCMGQNPSIYNQQPSPVPILFGPIVACLMRRRQQKPWPRAGLAHSAVVM